MNRERFGHSLAVRGAYLASPASGCIRELGVFLKRRKTQKGDEEEPSRRKKACGPPHRKRVLTLLRRLSRLLGVQHRAAGSPAPRLPAAPAAARRPCPAGRCCRPAGRPGTAGGRAGGRPGGGPGGGARCPRPPTKGGARRSPGPDASAPPAAAAPQSEPGVAGRSAPPASLRGGASPAARGRIRLRLSDFSYSAS